MVNAWTFIHKEWNPITWCGDVWVGPIEDENLNPQILKGLSQLRK